MNEMTCCFTGHRNLKKYSLGKLKIELENAIEKLISDGVVNFEAGGALGFDTIAALTVLKMEKKFQQIKLILILPCRNQAYKWNKSDIETYEYIKSQSYKFVYTSEDYYDDWHYRFYGKIYGKDTYNNFISYDFSITIKCKENASSESGYVIERDGISINI